MKLIIFEVIGLTLAIIIISLLLIALWIILSHLLSQTNFKWESGKTRAGRQGEEIADSLIRSVMNEHDILLSNLKISYDGKKAEIDKLIINSHGIFIIEVKNYNGILKGSPDDYNWLQTKVSPGGNIFTKEVQNPIRQVKRQTYILSKCLKEQGIYHWIDGYLLFINNNSPITDKMILCDTKDIYKAIHYNTGDIMNKETVKKIVLILKEENLESAGASQSLCKPPN